MSYDRKKPVYVLDTNVIIDYIDVIPGEDSSPPAEPSIDFSNAHIVIPSVVVRELSKFKNEKSDRGKSARTALRRIRSLAEGCVVPMAEVYSLERTVELNGQKFSILPVHKNLRESLPFHPSDEDMDGQIILTAIAVGMLGKGIAIDGAAALEYVERITFDNVVLVTNDNGLAIRARERGLKTERYGYKYPETYTGRRDIVVPKELFDEFYNTGKLDLEFWKQQMPDQPKLIANEFIIMRLEDERDYPLDFDPKNDPYFSHIGRYDAELRRIVKLRYTSGFPIKLHNDGQAIYAEALMDSSIAAVICRGPAGSGKTYMATAYGYNASRQGEFIGVTVVPCESHSKIGALPGNLDEKMDPDVQPFKNALRNYLLNEDPALQKSLNNFKRFGVRSGSGNGNGNGRKSSKNYEDGRNGKKRFKNHESDGDGRRKSGNYEDEGDNDRAEKSIKRTLEARVDMIWSNWFSNIPIENARGRDFSYELALYDEFQDQNVSQADTLIKRIGAEGKIVITGDLEQIHAPYIDASSSGLVYASRELIDDPMVAQVCFTEEEVIRHPLVKLIARRQKLKK